MIALENCVGCSFWPWGQKAGPSDTIPKSARTGWITIDVFNNRVEVKKDFLTRRNLGIRLPGKEGAPLTLNKGHVFRVIDKKNDLKFLVQIDRNTGEWLGVALMHSDFKGFPYLRHGF